MRNLDQLSDDECITISYMIGDGPFETPEYTKTYVKSWCSCLRSDYELTQPVVIYKFIKLDEYLKKIGVDVGDKIIV